MGLDIVAYEKLALDADGETVWVEHQFPQSRDINPDKKYSREGRSHGFRAGSYGYYNKWRNGLAQFALKMSDREVWAKCEASESGLFEGPFVELINFPDNEGAIGPAACAKLASDFEQHYARCKKEWPEGLGNYEDFREAFDLAADGGCVIFC